MIHDDDKKLLMYAGFLGHQFVGTCDSVPEPELGRGNRRVFCESSSKESCLDRYSTGLNGVRVYKRIGKSWTCVHQTEPITLTEPC